MRLCCTSLCDIAIKGPLNLNRHGLKGPLSVLPSCTADASEVIMWLYPLISLNHLPPRLHFISQQRHDAHNSCRWWQGGHGDLLLKFNAHFNKSKHNSLGAFPKREARARLNCTPFPRTNISRENGTPSVAAARHLLHK